MQAYNKKAVKQLQTLTSCWLLEKQPNQGIHTKIKVKNHKEKKKYVHIYTASRMNMIQV